MKPRQAIAQAACQTLIRQQHGTVELDAPIFGLPAIY